MGLSCFNRQARTRKSFACGLPNPFPTRDGSLQLPLAYADRERSSVGYGRCRFIASCPALGAIAAAESGRRVYYGTLGDLIASLEGASQSGRLLHRMKTLGPPSLLIVDEIGYLPISRTGAMLFFQLMSRRY